MPILIFLLVFGYGWASLLPNGCPADGDVHRLLPHETDCGKFYACSNGRRVLMHCPRGLSFNVELQMCDWPQIIDASTPETTTVTTTNFTTKTTPTLNTTTSQNMITTETNSTQTTNYTITTPVMTTNYTTTTPVMTTNYTTTTAILTTNYTTTTTVITTLPTISTSRPIPPHDCPSEWRVALKLPEDADCEKFFHCSESIKLLLKCPKRKLKNFDMVFSANYSKIFGNADF